MPLRPSPILDTRVVYCGDCLDQVKKLPDRSIDLVYIDPPFNSNRRYEVFWRETREERAFEDRHASTEAYIEFMRPRCEQLARVLKKTGTFYYHCDWHASHYVKVMLDRILGENNFLNEIVWRRTNSRTEEKQWPRVHDTILVYTGGGKHTFNPLLLPGDVTKAPHTLIKGPDGQKYNTKDLTGPGETKDGESGRAWRGFNPTSFGRHWGYAHAQLDAWDVVGLIHWPKSKGAAGGFPRLRDEKPFEPSVRMVQVADVWSDIDRLNQTSKERVGYPTQKPNALLDRIIRASSNPNDIVLDAFCGCGTAVTSAEKLGRQWIGIDVSPTACRVMAQRLRYECNLPMNEKHWKKGRGFIVEDLPKSEETLRQMPPFEFESWAVLELSGTPNVSKVRDMGVDGRIYPKRSAKDDLAQSQLDFMDIWYPVQVKQQDRVGREAVDKFETAIERERKEKGVMVAFSFTNDAKLEAHNYFQRTGKVISLVTVRDILDGRLHEKLA